MSASRKARRGSEHPLVRAGTPARLRDRTGAAAAARYSGWRCWLGPADGDDGGSVAEFGGEAVGVARRDAGLEADLDTVGVAGEGGDLRDTAGHGPRLVGVFGAVGGGEVVGVGGGAG